MKTAPLMIAALFVLSLVGVSAALLGARGAPEQAAAIAPSPPPLPAPLQAFSTYCAKETLSRGHLLESRRAAVSPAAAASLCDCLATRLKARFQDPRSARFAERRLTALIVSDKRRFRARALFAVARERATAMNMSLRHRRAVAETLDGAVLRCRARA